ncbi:sialidase family protein [Mesomycoplasma hyorhinis]|uniref:sialidase family protein n=1 Tax=Mesomycoplasma hyorhinis TaxID=2100 RepID=UPI001C05BAF0|nr:sialidase family protein [Mesomycoplasma hyorhinis]
MLASTGLDVIVVKLKEFENSIDVLATQKEGNHNTNSTSASNQTQPVVVSSLEEKRSKIKQDLYSSMLERQHFNIKKLSSSSTSSLSSKEYGYYSFVNPRIKKLADGEVLLSADGREFNDKDINNRINQVLLHSEDGRSTWDKNITQIVSVGGGKTNIGTANSESFIEVTNPKNPPEKN